MSHVRSMPSVAPPQGACLVSHVQLVASVRWSFKDELAVGRKDELQQPFRKDELQVRCQARCNGVSSL